LEEVSYLSENILKMNKICKSFRQTQVLFDVDFEVNAGEVVAIVGQNGAGKSTLMNIIAGVLKASSGQMLLDGHKIHLNSPREAAQLGIRMVHQELSLFPSMTISENLTIGNLPKTKLSLLDKKKMREKCIDRLKVFGIDANPNTKVGNVSIAEQQMLEICREIDDKTRILILDEPTSAIGNEEVDALFALIKRLKKSQNLAIIYISHRLAEVVTIADKIYVIRDGVCGQAVDNTDISHEKLVRMIVGDKDAQKIRAGSIQARQRSDFNTAETVLELKNICSRKLNDISLGLKQGEVLGIAGLMGSGRTEILKTIYGELPYDSGDILVKGQAMPGKYDCVKAIKQKICLIPEDRKTEGLNLGISIKNNVTLSILKKVSNRLCMIMDKKERQVVDQQVEAFRIKTASITQEVASLSGGNQQKVCLARGLVKQPEILLMDEPTRGVDIGAKEDIFDAVRRLSEEGVSILFISSEFEELLRVCDRVLILMNGKIIKECPVDNELSEEKLILYATGSGVQAKPETAATV
jgi:ribose transport system ATP-binding protein